MIDQLTPIMREAGGIVRKYFGRIEPGEVGHKSSVDLVTCADKETEEFLRTALGQAFPDVTFYGEEGEYGALSDHDRVFVVDPVDGTTGFVHAHPYHSVSLAYREGGVTKAGLVYAPYFDDMYAAEKGRGAFLNGEKIGVSTAERLIESLVGTGFACVRARTKPDNLPLFSDIIYRVRGVRRCGSAAIDLCYVACGIYELFWEYELAPYDVAAGVLIVEEAGGKVTDFLGGDQFEERREIAASNGLVHEEFLSVARQYAVRRTEDRK